eukprot:GCRY01000328.1.p1 GENE.GCRY01000328.1~~GCRY01000328.1.p1  ORF type:complete len:112 (+),score=28.92 GCRY01000328.1:98-433(+)
MSIANLETRDLFAEAEFDDATGSAPSQDIHVRIQMRNGRKSLTTISGLDPELNFKKILKAVKKTFACNGTIIEDENLGKIIQLQGDQRKNFAGFLMDEEIAKKEQIKIHGF